MTEPENDDNSRVIEMIRKLMDHHNRLEHVKRVLARLIRASFESDRAAIKIPPTVPFLNLAWKWMLSIASLDTEVDVMKGKLIGLSPIKVGGVWMTRGRLRKGMVEILGVNELPILLPHSRLSYLVMMAAHTENHEGPNMTLWCSRARA